MIWFALFFNFIIALAYLGLGLTVSPYLKAAGSSVGVALTKVSFIVFFLTCAYTHVHDSYHAYVGQAINFTSWHFLVAHGLQAVAAPLALYLSWRYLSVKIYNREHYERVLEESIEELERELAETEKAAL